MDIEIFPDADGAARRAAGVVAQVARAAIAARGRFVFAVSGGTTPGQMLHYLSAEDLPWELIFIAQVDERVAPAGHADRNLTLLQKGLTGNRAIRTDHVLAMPVEDPDLELAAARYGRTLESVAGAPLILDLVHLGLGPDGHTASLVPNDPVLSVVDRDVAITGEYQGRRRMTLTYPPLNRARFILWLVTGASKAGMLVKLKAADATIPGGRVNQANATILADRDASSKL
jgi:6-phosphogluconolactonase